MNLRLPLAFAALAGLALTFPMSGVPVFAGLVRVLALAAFMLIVPHALLSLARTAHSRLAHAATESLWNGAFESDDHAVSVSSARLDTVRLLGESRSDGARPLAGGPGRLQDANRAMMDELRTQCGSIGLAALSADAEWVATKDALHVVSPRLEAVMSWDWSQVESVSVGDAARAWELFVRVELSGGRCLHLATDRASGRHLLPVARRLSAAARPA